MSLFQKNLTDLIKGIRSNKRNEAGFIAQCISEIKQELKQKEVESKVAAVQKLTYLYMLGYDMDWAAFHVVECMSHPRFAFKRVGYLAASLTFDTETDVLILTTSQFKKDLISANQYEISLALNCLSNICTTDLARDLVADVVSLLNSSHSFVRKKAILVLYKIFVHYPDALRPSFPRIKEKFDDAAPTVVSATVNLICELARKNPKNYLSLAPTLYKILTTTTNNWMLIKIVKLFGALCPLEPRLGKKLVDPLTTLMNTTPAKSVLYECIMTCIAGMTQYSGVMKLCADKLRELVMDTDQNLKYLGLLGLSSLMKASPRFLLEHKDTILRCLEDEDLTIRLRAIDLLDGVTTRKNIKEVARRLVQLLPTAEDTYRESLIKVIVELCHHDKYARVSDFEWYISTLIELARVPAMQQGVLICSELLDVTIRIDGIEGFAVSKMKELLSDKAFMEPSSLSNSNEILYAAAFIVGEFGSDELENDDEIDDCIHAMLSSNVTSLPAHIQAIFVHNAVKLFAFMVPDTATSSSKKPSLLEGFESESTATTTGAAPTDSNSGLPDDLVELKEYISQTIEEEFAQSSHVEVQERAASSLLLLDLCGKLPVAELFDDPLVPLGSGAQDLIEVPDDLDLDAWINSPPESPRDIDLEQVARDHSSFDSSSQISGPSPTGMGYQQYQAQRKDYYLPTAVRDIQVDDIPVQHLSAKDLDLEGHSRHHRHHRKHGDRKKYAVKSAELLPEVTAKPKPKEQAAATGTGSGSGSGTAAQHDQLDIDLDAPLNANEKLYEVQKYPDANESRMAAAITASKKPATETTAAPTAATAAAPEKPASKTDRRQHRHHRHHHHREGATTTGAAATSTATAATTKSDVVNTTNASSPLIDLGDMSYHQISSPTSGTPSSTVPSRAFESSASPVVSQPTTAAVAPAATTTDRRRHHRRHHASSTDVKPEAVPQQTSPVSSSSSSAAPASTESTIVTRTLIAIRNADLTFSYHFRCDNTNTKQFYLVVSLQSNSDNLITNCMLDMSDTMTLRIQREEQGPIALEVNGKTEIPIQFNAFASPQRLNASFTYLKSGSSTMQKVYLVVPVSSIVCPVQTNSSALAQVMQSGKLTEVTAVQVRLGGRTLAAVQQEMTRTVHLLPVEQQGQQAVMMYGVSLSGVSVAALCKLLDGDKLQVDVRSSVLQLSQSLAGEVTGAFGAL